MTLGGPRLRRPTVRSLGAALHRPEGPNGAGDLSVETHGIAPVPSEQRYGSPARLFTVWFAPQVNMTGVFTGAMAIVLGLGFWLGLLAMVIGTVLGSLVVGVPVDVGSAHRRRAVAERADGFRRRRLLPGRLQWCRRSRGTPSSDLFGGKALAAAARHPVLGRPC